MASDRRRAWTDRRIVGVSLVAGTHFTRDLLFNAPTSDTQTVERIIGHIEVYYLTAAVPEDSESIVDMGIGVSSIEAFEVAAAAGLPSPADETEYPPRGWLYVQSKGVRQVVSTSGDGLIDVGATFDFDLRGKRKVDKGVLFLSMIQANIATGGAMQVVGRVRVLCLT